MKKWVVLFFICCLANNFSQTSISPQFSELKGMEDQQGNTHLFYRIYTSFENPPIYSWSNHIYHWDLESETDTLYISSSGHEDPAYNFNRSVNDVDYWNDNPAEFIYSGGETSGQFFEGSAYIQRFDGYIHYFGLFWGTASYIDISQSDDSLLYSGILTDGGPGILKSTDGGRSWDSVSTDYQFLSLCPSNENIFFVENEDRELYRTTDGGNTFNLVDPEFLVDTRFFYDPDGLHIYRYSNNKLVVSNSLGEQFSWQTKYSSDTEIYISIDESNSGTIYLADKKNIFVSTDYSNNFSLYKSLERKIVGIYKKPNSNKLYAATKYRIYEITPDTMQVIKSIPIPQEVLNYYPLLIGNKWISLTITVINPNVYYDVILTEVLDDSIASNNKLYYHLKEGNNHYLDRVDSLDGRVYRYFEHPNLPENEYVVADLLGEVGDSIPSFDPTYPTAYSYTKLIRIDTFNKWGLTKLRKLYHQVTPGLFHSHLFSFTEDIGPDSLFSGGWYGYGITILKGCIINGVVYGDTTLTDIDDEENPIASDFKLEQNYPNPFNPSTVISYRIPVTSNVTLKIYDVIGNEIAMLVNEAQAAGEYEVDFNASSGIRHLVSGIYFYQLKAGDFIQTKKMLMIK